jgi:spore cortex biosynthesis protein YabQ
VPVYSSSSMVLEQLYAFLEALTLGAALAACYDIYRAVRRQGFRRPPAAALFVVDLLFWLLASLACLAAFIVRRWGEVHFYTYLGLGGGSVCYFYLLSRFLLPAWNKLFAIVFRLCRKIFRLLEHLLSAAGAPFRQAARAVRKNRNFFSRCGGRIFRIIRRN